MLKGIYYSILKIWGGGGLKPCFNLKNKSRCTDFKISDWHLWWNQVFNSEFGGVNKMKPMHFISIVITKLSNQTKL